MRKPGKKRKSKRGAPEQPARREATRERLLRAARDIITEKGFQRTSLDEIAARAGLTKGAVYDNFQSKDELFGAVVAAWTAERVGRQSWPAGRSGNARERMRRLADMVITEAPHARVEAPMRAELLLYMLTHPELSRRAAKASGERFADMRRHLLQLFSAEELPVPVDTFIIMLEALIPGLMFIRAQVPELVSDRIITQIFESFAGKEPP